MVVGPRYNPAPVVQSVDFRPGGNGWAQAKSQAKSRAKPIRSQTAIASRRPCRSRQERADQSDRITVRLQAGFPLGEVKSHHHAVQTETRMPRPASSALPTAWCGGSRLRADLEGAAEKAPSVGLFREHVGNADYLLAFVTPPRSNRPSRSR